MNNNQGILHIPVARFIPEYKTKKQPGGLHALSENDHW